MVMRSRLTPNRLHGVISQKIELYLRKLTIKDLEAKHYFISVLRLHKICANDHRRSPHSNMKPVLDSFIIEQVRLFVALH
jgi:hypothetical protein